MDRRAVVFPLCLFACSAPAPVAISPASAPVGTSNAPLVTSVSPSPGSTGAGRNTQIALVFTEVLDPATTTAEQIVVSGAGGLVAGTFRATAKSLTFRPEADLLPDTRYEVTVTTGLRSASGAAI